MTVERLYLVEALTLKMPGAEIPPDFLQQAYAFHKWITITLMLSWSAIMSVKFSFLFLFRGLIQRIHAMVIYWWLVTGFNVVVLGYGLAVYYVACPYAHGPEICTASFSELLHGTNWL